VTAGAVEILVAGEALIDLVERSCGGERAFFPTPGGSPMNVAVGLARLGVPTGFLARLSRDAFGELLYRHLEENDVAMEYVLRGGGASTLAFVLARDGEEPQYAFYAGDAADRDLVAADLPGELSETVRAIHVGSYALAVEPIGSALRALAEREGDRRTISLDPNVRLSLVGDRDRYRGMLEEWIDRSDIVKISRADAGSVWPGSDIAILAADWLERRPSVVVVTDGPRPIRGWTRDAQVTVDGRPVQIVDTVGAGDAFTAGLLCWLHDKECLDRSALDGLSESHLRGALTFAARVAGATCARRGADPPSRQQLGTE